MNSRREISFSFQPGSQHRGRSQELRVAGYFRIEGNPTPTSALSVSARMLRMWGQSGAKLKIIRGQGQ